MISMMMGSAFIGVSAHALAEMNVRERSHKKQDRYTEENCVLHRVASDPKLLELHEDRHRGPILGVTKIRLKARNK
jgi:hypothetical protein